MLIEFLACYESFTNVIELDRRERRKEKTRQALLDVALRLIAERGIYGTRIEDITERSDLGKGAFYNYFESKDRLIAELISRGVDLLQRDYLPEPPPATDSAQRVTAVIAGHEAFFADHAVFVILFHQARGLAKMRAGEHAALTEAFIRYLKWIGHFIVPPDDRHHVAEEVLVELAAALLGTIAGQRSFRIVAGLPIESPMITEVLTSGLAAAIAARVRKPT